MCLTEIYNYNNMYGCKIESMDFRDSHIHILFKDD